MDDNATTFQEFNKTGSVYTVAAVPICMVAAMYALLSPKSRSNLARAFHTLGEYYRTLYFFCVQGGSFKDCPYFPESLHSRCHIYSLSLIFKLWDLPHYRNGTFQDDMLKNLRDVAIPGTGLPLSLFAYTKVGVYFLIVVLYPIIALVAALAAGGWDVEDVTKAFIIQLVAPQDWFSFWRLNCRLATFHSSVTRHEDYKLEDKWTFLTEAEKRNVAVTPYMKVSGIVCKHRNEEGGLGFESFKNASVGGDWIIQRKLDNGLHPRQYYYRNSFGSPPSEHLLQDSCAGQS